MNDEEKKSVLRYGLVLVIMAFVGSILRFVSSLGDRGVRR